MGILKQIADQLTKNGWINGHDFPVGTYIHFSKDEGDSALRVTFPSGEEFKITHDMVKYAAVIAMGVIDIKGNSNGGNTLLHGTKIRFELKDGRTGVITCSIGESLNKIEHILF